MTSFVLLLSSVYKPQRNGITPFQFIGYTQLGSLIVRMIQRFIRLFSPQQTSISLLVWTILPTGWAIVLKGTFHIAPLAYNLKYTRMLELSDRLGIGTGHHFLHDFGSECTIDLEWKLFEMLTWRTRLYGYTTYRRRRWSGRIHSPSNSTVTYQLNCLFIRALTMV